MATTQTLVSPLTVERIDAELARLRQVTRYDPDLVQRELNRLEIDRLLDRRYSLTMAAACGAMS